MRDLDRAFRASLAPFTGGLAPSALAGAYLDWAVHLIASPGKQLELAGQTILTAAESLAFAADCAHRAASDPF
jgi:polyhydroxyalkanoate synthase